MNTDVHGSGRRRSLWKGPALVAALIVSMLLLASRLIDDWHWHPGAFGVVGALIFTIGFVYELVTRNRDAFAYRAAVGMAFTAGFMLMWSSFVQMADVTPFAALHFSVPMVGIIGAAVARLRPRGMALALSVTALAQALVVAAVFILIALNPQATASAPPVWRGVFGNTFLIGMFLGSAWLFRKAGREEAAVPAA
jgi:protein-S-isoprenylcysteine O-methyltransferase Ste14